MANLEASMGQMSLGVGKTIEDVKVSMGDMVLDGDQEFEEEDLAKE